jgi:SAM-dependent methyltransferase
MLEWSVDTPCAAQCRVCGSPGPLAEWVTAPHVITTEADVRFARCAQCGSLSALQDILAFDHIQQGDIEIFLRQYVESTAGLWEMFWPVASLASASDKTLLDVGCGFGFTADAWRTVVNPRAFGCDPAPYAAAGRSLLGEHIFHALLDDVAELNGALFDVVYSSEVIEHVPDPEAFARLLRSRLNSGGTLVLTTPAADYILPTSDPSTTSAALAAGFHGFLFSRDALENLLHGIGFAHVVVERHGERLIAWAADHEVARVPVEGLFTLYTHYLALKVAELNDATDPGRTSLRTGYAFRLFKDRYLRGHHADIDALRRMLLADMVFGHDLNVETADSFAAPFAALDNGAEAFGTVARYCFPQLALLFGFYAEHQERDPKAAYAWYELVLVSTQKLCGLTVLSGLEAAAFYWQAMMRALAIDINAGRPNLALTRLLACVEATVEPEPLIGGSAPPAAAILQMLDGWITALLSRRDSVGLLALASAFTDAQPKNAKHAAAVAFRDLCNLARGLALLSEALVRRDGPTARDCLARMREPAATQHHVEVEWRAALEQRLNALESQIPVANATSFAAAPQQYRWSATSTAPKRWG